MSKPSLTLGQLALGTKVALIPVLIRFAYEMKPVESDNLLLILQILGLAAYEYIFYFLIKKIDRWEINKAIAVTQKRIDNIESYAATCEHDKTLSRDAKSKISKLNKEMLELIYKQR